MWKKLIWTMVLCIGSTGTLWAQTADYGDAPDGQSTGYPAPFATVGRFPTLRSSNGARTLDVTRMTLGPGADRESDARMVNADTDDGVLGLTIVLTGISPCAQLEVGVSVGTGGTFWLNVLIDLNMDGQWPGWGAGGEYEHVVRNVPVTLVAGGSRTLLPPLFAFGDGSGLPNGAWMRVALTDSPIHGAWDGSGEFVAGEIEDYVVRMPTFANTGKVRRFAAVRWAPSSPIKMRPPAMVNLTASVTVMPPPPPAVWVSYKLKRRSGGVNINGAKEVSGGGLVNSNPLVFNFVATDAGVLPSTWEYHFWTKDPLSYVTATAVIIGFPDHMGTIDFVPDDGTTHINDQFVVTGYDESLLTPGLTAFVHQLDTPRAGSIALAQSQLRGELGPNVANPYVMGVAMDEGRMSEFPNGPIIFDIPGVINLNQTGGLSEGSFPADGQMPGIPGLTDSHDNIAIAIETWLELPAGPITMGVNSDDGFRITIGGPTPDDVLAQVVGEYDRGRASADSIFSFIVLEPGLYAARLEYFESGGGANVEWYTVLEDDSKVLVNDRVNGGVPAYIMAPGPQRAAVTDVTPRPDGVLLSGNSIQFELRQGDYSMGEDSIAVELDGERLPTTLHKWSGVEPEPYFGVECWPEAPLEPFSEHNIKFSYIDKVPVSRAFKFTAAGSPPLADWDSEFEGGIVYDSSGNGLDGTVIGDVDWVDGVVGDALHFNGGRVEIPDDPLLDIHGRISLAVWFKTHGFKVNWAGILTKGDSAYRLQRNGASRTMEFAGSGLDVQGAPWSNVLGVTPVDDGEWHHLAGTYDGTEIKLYIDGAIDGSAPASGSIATNNYPVVIGGNAERPGREWYGPIDDVKIWDRALSKEEILAECSGPVRSFSTGSATNFSQVADALGMFPGNLERVVLDTSLCTLNTIMVSCLPPEDSQDASSVINTQISGEGSTLGQQAGGGSRSLAGHSGPTAMGSEKVGLIDQLFPRGQGPVGYTVCASSEPASAGPYVLIIVGYEGEIPLQHGSHIYQYGAVFDSDGKTSNNYVPPSAYPNDFFAYTDKWYELTYNPGSGWALKVTDVRRNFTTVASKARVVIAGSEMAWFIPRGELDSDTASWRISSFAHTGDYGLSGGFWSGDYYPLVQDPLIPIAPVESTILIGP